jgi:hypothetical protein
VLGLLIGMVVSTTLLYVLSCRFVLRKWQLRLRDSKPIIFLVTLVIVLLISVGIRRVLPAPDTELVGLLQFSLTCALAYTFAGLIWWQQRVPWFLDIVKRFRQTANNA